MDGQACLNRHADIRRAMDSAGLTWEGQERKDHEHISVRDQGKGGKDPGTDRGGQTAASPDPGDRDGSSGDQRLHPETFE